MNVLQSYGVGGQRSHEHPGIWVRDKQIAAVGLRYSHGISMHGLSLNVHPDLSLFKVINLCGLPDRSATSITEELGRVVPVEEVSLRVQEAFCEVFNVVLRNVSKEDLSVICEQTGPRHEVAIDATVKGPESL